jgi:hypothetical protein
MAVEPDMRRYHAWQRRILLNGGGVTLGSYGELWEDQPDHPGREVLMRLAAARGSADLPTDTFTRTLLRDILHAAGGVEHHAERVIAALDQSQHEQETLVETNPEYGWRSDAGDQHVAIKESLAWDYPDLLTWLRAVEERVDHSFQGTRFGLLPAIAETELRDDVDRLFQTFKGRVGDERRLANYGLHAAKVPDPNTPTGLLQEDAAIVVPIPDPPEDPVYVFDQFTYEQDRDLRSFTIEALTATQQFVDGLLDAFVRAHERVEVARGNSAPGA